MTTPNDDDFLDSVPLDPVQDPLATVAPAVKVETAETYAAPVTEESDPRPATPPTAPPLQSPLSPEDPWANLEDLDDAPDEEDSPENTETQEALSKLKSSSVRLGQALDQRVGFSSLWSSVKQTTCQAVEPASGKLSETAKTAAEKMKLSETTKSATEKMTSWFQTMDESLGVSGATKDLSQSFQENVVKAHIQPSLQKSTRKLTELDHKHGLTKSTAESLRKGADYLTQSLSAGAAASSVNENETGTREPKDEPAGGAGA